MREALEMIICAAGDNHGAIDMLYSEILDFEGALNVCFEVVLHVGDFGIWPFRHGFFDAEPLLLIIIPDCCFVVH